MKFDDDSRAPGRAPRRALLTLAAVALGAAALAALATPWTASGCAQPACGDDIIFNVSVVTDLPSIDCQTAKERAYRKALQTVENQRAAYVCPQACPTLATLTPAHLLGPPTCQPIETQFGTRWYGLADAEGTYECVNPNP
jgi:hypothetical protein